MNHRKIILGSGSPRRKELLTSIWNGAIDVYSSDIDEVYPSDLAFERIPEYLSTLKANDIQSKIGLEDHLLLTADTIVICENTVLGKPRDRTEAIDMLRFLSNKRHDVITGVQISSSQKSVSFSEKTSLWFVALTDEQIGHYIDAYHPLDKAGSYGIQEWIGMIGISRIEGCYYNVMGLPTSRVWRELSSF